MKTKRTKRMRKEEKIKQASALLRITELNKRDRTMTQKEESTATHPDGTSEETPSKKIKLSHGSPSPDVPHSLGYENTDQSQSGLINEGSLSKLSDAQLAELRSLLKKRRNDLRKKPLLKLKESSGSQADISVPATDRIPIFFSDIQHLVLFSVLAQNSPCIPRWCELERCGQLSAVQILFIEGAGISDFLHANERLIPLSEANFPIRLEVVMPTAYNGNLIEEFCTIPLSQNQRNNIIAAYGSLENAVKSSCEVFKVLRAFFPINDGLQPSDNQIEQTATPTKITENSADEIRSPVGTFLPSTDKFPRTSLLLSAWQMIAEGYPLRINAALKEKYKDFVSTKHVYKEVNNFSPMYGLDCEMCMTSIGKSECTRVSIVNEKHETVLDTLVLPYNKITNYLTHYSGITPSKMENVTTRLEDVQKFIQENLEPDAILVGQSLNFDLIALQMIHPYCIDTSVIFNVTGDRNRKSKLSYLAERFLNESIQTGHQGHCSVEDSTTSLQLVQLKLSQSIEFGDKVLSGETDTENCTKGIKCQKSDKPEDLSKYATSLFSYASRMEKHSSILASPQILDKYVDYLNPQIVTYEKVNEDGSCEPVMKGETSASSYVTCTVTPSNQSVTDRIATKALDSFLSIGHIQLSEKESEALLSADDVVLERISTWVSKMQSTAPTNGLSMVLLCGREKSSNGACFIKVSTEPHSKLIFHPNDS